MKLKQWIFFFCLLVSGISLGQKGLSKGDALFFEYQYQKAIREYLKEAKTKPLNTQQYLNLAESYLKMNNYDQATTTYLEIYSKDSVLSGYHLNKMLQAMTVTKGNESVRAFLSSNPSNFTPEIGGEC